MDIKYIIIIVVLIIIISVCAILIVKKKKKDKIANEPIHKEYDASIENIVKEETNNEQINQFENVGTVAKPVIDKPDNIQTTEEITPTKEITSSEVIEQTQPEIAISNNSQIMDNYEITLPEEQKVMEMTQNANINQTVVKSEPIFMTNIPEEDKPIETKKQEIIIDEPNVEEL